MNKQVAQAKNILVINLLYLGDLVFSTPFLRNLRKNYPTAKIDMVVNTNFLKVVENNPYLNDLYPYSKSYNLKESIAFALRLKKNHYDLGLNIHGSLRSNLLLSLINPGYKVGFAHGIMKFTLNRSLQPLNGCHMVDVYLQFLRDMGITNIDDQGLELTVPKSALKKIELFLEKNKITRETRLIGLNTGGTWKTKRWTVEGFAQLADELQSIDHCQVVFLGGPGDLPRVKSIIGLMKTTPLMTTGQTSLTELMALLEKCSLVISNDSGPVHIAAAVGTPTITIFGPSDEIKYRPYGKNNLVVKSNLACRPCGKHECPLKHHKCMVDIKTEKILQKAQLLLEAR